MILSRHLRNFLLLLLDLCLGLSWLCHPEAFPSSVPFTRYAVQKSVVAVSTMLLLLQLKRLCQHDDSTGCDWRVDVLVRDGHKYPIVQRLCLPCLRCDLKVCEFQEGPQFVLIATLSKVSGAIERRGNVVRVTCYFHLCHMVLY